MSTAFETEHDQDPEGVDDDVLLEDRTQDASSPNGSGVLPDGFLDADGTRHRDFILTEMSGREEDLLASIGTKKAEPYVVMSKILANCTESIGTLPKSSISRVIDDLTIIDRYKLLISVRELSIGRVVEVVAKCPVQGCGHTDKLAVDLKDLKFTEAPTTQRDFEHTVSGRKIKWSRPVGRDERWSSSLSAKSKEDIPTIILLQRIREIDGVPLKRGTPIDDATSVKRIKALPFKVRVGFRKLIKENESWVDDTIEHKCSNCGYEHSFAFEIDASFFYP